MNAPKRRNEMKKGSRRGLIFPLMLLALILGACVGQTAQSEDQPLEPRADANQESVKFLIEGNRLFEKQYYREAATKYEAAIKAQSSSGEAHYNLGLALSKRSLYSEARPHFEKAAELEPFNTVIRNAPPFQKYTTVEPSTPEPASDGHMGHQH
jgi:tetratricopeptide (TPR) repeat protein